MVVLVTAIECFVAVKGRDLCDPVSLSCAYSTLAARAERQAASSSVSAIASLSTGSSRRSSRMKQAGGPRISRLRRTDPDDLLLASPRDRRRCASRAIILNAKPAVLLANPEFNLRYWQEVLTARECAFLLGVDHRIPFAMSLLAGRLLPTLRARLEVRSSLRAAVLGEIDPVRASNPVLWRNWTQNGGANISPVDFSARAGDVNQVGSLNRADLFFVRPIQRRGHPMLGEFSIGARYSCLLAFDSPRRRTPGDARRKRRRSGLRAIRSLVPGAIPRRRNRARCALRGFSDQLLCRSDPLERPRRRRSQSPGLWRDRAWRGDQSKLDRTQFTASSPSDVRSQSRRP